VREGRWPYPEIHRKRYLRGVCTSFGGSLSNDPGLLLSRDPDTVRAPDLAYYRENVRLEEISPGLAKRLPDLVVEVLSPSDRLGMVMRKVQQYLRAGIAMVWVVDGESRNVTVYRSGREPRVLEENEVLDGEEVLPGFTCPVSELFHLPGTVMETAAASTVSESQRRGNSDERRDGGGRTDGSAANKSGMVASDAGKLLTVEEFLALCERPEYADTQLELDEGRLVVMPPAGELHGTLCWLVDSGIDLRSH
jgi:Uma2 family endonuclease